MQVSPSQLLVLLSPNNLARLTACEEIRRRGCLQERVNWVWLGKLWSSYSYIVAVQGSSNQPSLGIPPPSPLPHPAPQPHSNQTLCSTVVVVVVVVPYLCSLTPLSLVTCRLSLVSCLFSPPLPPLPPPPACRSPSPRGAFFAVACRIDRPSLTWSLHGASRLCGFSNPSPSRITCFACLLH